MKQHDFEPKIHIATYTLVPDIICHIIVSGVMKPVIDELLNDEVGEYSAL